MSSDSSAGTVIESTADERRTPGVTRRGVLASAAGVAGAAAVPTFSGDASAAALVDGGATIYDGLQIAEYGYDYAPTVMFGDGDHIKMWWCANGGGTGDGIFYSEFTSTGWTDPVEVMGPSSSGWDSVHVCDPSVVKGSFVDHQYDYAMYYTGTDRTDNFNTRIGVAFSNDGKTWTKWPHNPVVTPAGDASEQYGAGLPTAYRHAGTSDDVTLAFYDSTVTPRNHYSKASDAVTFGPRTDLTANPDPGRIGDVAYFPDEGIWYICTKSDDSRRCYLYKTATSDLNSTWTPCGRIDGHITGNTANHNPCWMRWPNGHLYEGGTTRYKYVFFATGDDGEPSTWDIGRAKYLDGWEFDDDGNKEGWTSYNVSADSGEPSSGSWKCIADQSDPNFVSPSLEIDADDTSTVVVYMSNHNADSNGRIYFERAGDSGFGQTRSVGFDVDTTGDWIAYRVDMSSNSYWYGTVRRLRVDPIRDGTGDSLGISYIRLDS